MIGEVTNAPAALLCALALAAGCQSRNAKLISGGVSSGVALTSTVAVATHDGEQSVPLTALAITSGAFALGALLAGLSHDTDERPTQHIGTPDHREEAWEYTKHAKAAARVGDCITVAAHARIVRELDAEFHTLVFMRDAAIVRCLSPTGIPLVTPAADA